MATGKGNSFITSLLTLMFNNTNMANYGDATGVQGSGTAGSFYLSLHTADPGATGSQTASEAAYTGYARVAVARSSAGFTISGETVTLTSNVSFPAGTGGGETCTYVAIGRSSSGAGAVLYRCTLTPSIVTGSGITPVVLSGGTGVVEA